MEEKEEYDKGKAFTSTYYIILLWSEKTSWRGNDCWDPYFLALAVEFMVVPLFLILLIWPRTKNWTIYITVKPMMMQVISPRKLRKKKSDALQDMTESSVLSYFAFPKNFHSMIFTCIQTFSLFGILSFKALLV